MKKLFIVGASGHGKVVADIARKNGYTDIIFLDDDISRTECGKYSVVGKPEIYSKEKGDLFVAIGNAIIRKKIMDKMGTCVTLVHPNAVIAEDVEIGEGTVIMAGAVINPGTKIGRGCIINTCSSVDHDCTIHDFVHVSVGSHICGTVNIENETWVGAGAVIKNNLYICSECMIGAGAVVIHSIMNKCTVVGCPARPI